MRFVGREDLLSRLDAELDRARRGPGRLLAIRGRRQVGKSTLLERFLGRAELPGVFFVASRQPPDVELARLADAIGESGIPEVAELARGGSLGSWEAALTILATAAHPDRPLVLVIDEFPYLIESSPEIEAVLQKVWDRTLERSNVLVALIGSDLAMMRALSEYGRPLYGRVTELVVPPLSPAEVADMLGLAPSAAIDAYLVVGGFPRLAASWLPGDRLWDFLERELSDAMSPLAVVGERSLAAEFPPETHARLVLEAIGSGARSFADIGRRAGVPQTSLNRALETLQRKGVVARETPYSAARSQRSPRYLVSDEYLRFWLRFVGPGLELMQRGRGDLVTERLRRTWREFRGVAVEPLVRRSVARMLPDERFGRARFVGGYWTRDGRVEVDLVGGRGERQADAVDFVGSIKWRESAAFGRQDAARLAAARAAVPGTTPSTRLVGVSRSGFRSAGVDVEIGPEDLFAAWRQRA